MGASSQSRYQSFNQFPSAPRKQKFWDPISILDIINPLEGCLTCVGYAAKPKRRCLNAINARNRGFAFALLDKLSYIDASTTDISEELLELAGLTLCLRNHQNQQFDMALKWSKKIEDMQTKSRYYSKVKVERAEEQWEDVADLLAQLRYYQKQYGRQSTKEEHTRKRREEETHTSTERERERERQRKQQEREERDRKERQEKKREENKKREEERKCAEEKEQKKREEEKRRKEEQQAREREAREREERNERIRQRAEQARKERERKAKEQAAKEREEWDKVWLKYVLPWEDLKNNGAKGTSDKLREIIPWPVKSGHWKDVTASAVEEFFQKAPPESHTVARRLDTMKMECLKWHTDRIPRLFGDIDEDLAGLFKTVAQVAIKIRAETARKRER